MDTVITIVGIVFIALGIFLVVKPVVLKRMWKFFIKGKRLYLAGLLRFTLAVIFLIGAGECKNTPLIIVFGIIFLISGLLIFMIRLEKLKSIIGWWQNRSIAFLRIPALILLAIGIIIVCSA